jgi:4-amino-4-deoxy-L-arabinose transferase-like glycosyltransferase
MAYLAGVWHVAGYSIATTRLAMLAVAAAAVVASYSLARRLCRGLPGTPALVAAAWLSVSPLFFAQAMLAQLDLPAMLLTSLALILFLDGRRGASVAACTALVLVKETGVLVPLVLGLWTWREKGWRAAAVYCWPGVALGVWLAVLATGAGHPLGNAEFARYNLQYPLHPARLIAALARRLHALFLADFHWIGTLAMALAWRRTRLFAAREWRVAGTVGLAHLAAFTVAGGAALERYLLPVLPILYAGMAAATETLARLPRRVIRLALAAGLLAGIFWNPPYPFPLENNLAFTDYVKLHQSAADFVQQRYPGGVRILTAWPLSQALARPELGYVARGFKVRELRDFRPSSITAADWSAAELFILYSTTWNPRWSWLRVPIVRRVWELYYGYEPDLSRPPPPWRLTARWSRRGQWIELHVK